MTAGYILMALWLGVGSSGDDGGLVAARQLHKAAQTADDFSRAFDAYFEHWRTTRSSHPDILWGLGECGQGSASKFNTDPAARLQRLKFAQQMYRSYAVLEYRPEFAVGEKSRAARARARANQLVSEIAAAEQKTISHKTLSSSFFAVRADQVDSVPPPVSSMTPEEHLRCLLVKGLTKVVVISRDGREIMVASAPRDTPCPP